MTQKRRFVIPKETPGERSVKSELKHLKLHFEQEVEIHGLRGDTSQHRRADFYLPDYNIYIEYLGDWDRSSRDKQRYNEKKRVYELNKVNCIWIYPHHLKMSSKIIQDGLLKYGVDLSKITEEEKKQAILFEKKNKANQIIKNIATITMIGVFILPFILFDQMPDNDEVGMYIVMSVATLFFVSITLWGIYFSRMSNH